VIVLRSRPFRSVLLEPVPGGAPVVVKRYHHPGRLRAFLDGARARRELAALSALAAAGLPVPAPLGVARVPGAGELRMAAVPDARDLAVLLASGAPPPGGWERLCVRLGRLLARLQALGFEHGDLHPGNVLVDAHGAPWLVDVQRVRRGTGSAERRWAALAECEASAREALPPRVRVRFLVAWLRATSADARPAGALPELARRLARNGRTLRARRVVEGLGRWLRESSRVRGVGRAPGIGWLRRDLPDAVLAELEDDTRFTVLRAGARELEARWLGAARLHEHGLPVERPALLVPRRRATFERPERVAASRASLMDRLAERGLALRSTNDACAVTASGCWFRPPRAAEIEVRSPT
jgi:Ser/Thr protein kinase RdoA (MazF antagonist)